MKEKEVRKIANEFVVRFSGKTFSNHDDVKTWLSDKLCGLIRSVEGKVIDGQIPCHQHVDAFVEIVECNECNVDGRLLV